MSTPASHPHDPRAAAGRRQWRREQRQIARLHHPDVGGDPEQFLRLMRELDHRYGIAAAAEAAPAAGTGPPVTVVRTAAGRLKYQVRRGLRRSGRALRSHLPRQVPGSRRYIDL